MQLFASNGVKEKIIGTHGVSFLEAEEAFNNFSGFPLKDIRAAHRSKPTTVWCLAETYDGRLLKLVFVPFPEAGYAILRTAYEPDDVEIDLWNEKQ
jgi:hypothetical protein